MSKLAESGIDFDVPDELLEGVAGGYDPSAYNPATVADGMKAAIAKAKKAGMGKDQMLESYIANANRCMVDTAATAQSISTRWTNSASSRKTGTSCNIANRNVEKGQSLFHIFAEWSKA